MSTRTQAVDVHFARSPPAVRATYDRILDFRLTSPREVDQALRKWLRAPYEMSE